MIKIRVNKKLFEGAPAAPAAGQAPAAPANSTAPAAGQTPAAPAQGGAQALPAAPAANAQQPAANAQDANDQQPQIDGKKIGEEITTFTNGIAESIKNACTQDAITKAVPELVDLGKNDAFKAAIEPLNKAMAAMKNAKDATETLTQYTELVKAFSGLATEINKQAGAEGGAQQGSQAAPAQPAANPTAPAAQ